MSEAITLQSIFDLVQQSKRDTVAHMDLKIDTLGSSLKKINDSLHMLGDQVTEVQQRVSANEDNIAELLKRISVLEKENAHLKKWTEDTENRSRRSNLRFIGIPEKAEGNNIHAFMSGLIPQLFGKVNFPLPPGIEICHRVGNVDNKENVTDKGPRPILVKFQNLREKTKIKNLAKDKKDPLVFKIMATNRDGSSTEKEVKVHIYPDYSAGVVKKRKEFDEVKKKFRDRDIEYGLFFPSTLRVTHNGKSHYFRKPDDAEKFYNALDSSSDSDMAI